jgi:hypothetical protein
MPGALNRLSAGFPLELVGPFSTVGFDISRDRDGRAGFGDRSISKDGILACMSGWRLPYFALAANERDRCVFRHGCPCAGTPGGAIDQFLNAGKSR